MRHRRVVFNTEDEDILDPAPAMAPLHIVLLIGLISFSSPPHSFGFSHDDADDAEAAKW